MGPTLLPNFGAEEGRRREALAAAPILEEVAALWLVIFGADAGLLGTQSSPPWPEALGPRPAQPAFPWLEHRSRGVSWLSTRPAWDELREAGAAPAMPPPAVVERVHDKGFALEVAREHGLTPTCLEGHLELLSSQDLSTGVATGRIAEWLARLPPWVHGSWTIKPRLGSSGRGRIGGRDADSIEVRSRLSASALARLAARGGAICEPWLSRCSDLSTQLHISRAGAVELLGTTRQILSPAGGYLGNCGLLDPEGRSHSGSPFDEGLRPAALLLGEAAAGAGYFGPCGVDAFTFLGPGQEEILRPVVEFNARFTLGTIALGLVQRAKAAGLLEGMRSYRFLLRPSPQPPPPETAAALRAAVRIPLGREAVLLLSPTEALATSP